MYTIAWRTHSACDSDSGWKVENKRRRMTMNCSEFSFFCGLHVAENESVSTIKLDNRHYVHQFKKHLQYFCLIFVLYLFGFGCISTILQR